MHGLSGRGCRKRDRLNKTLYEAQKLIAFCEDLKSGRSVMYTEGETEN